jgi:FkbM family methyltransferase
MRDWIKTALRPLIEPLREPLLFASQRLPFPHAVAFRLPTRWAHRNFKVYMPEGDFFWCGGSRDSIGYELCFHGLWHQRFRKPETSLLLEEISRSRKFLDIGANTGLFTIAGCAANTNLQVLAVEALPTQCQMLRENIRLNAFERRVIVRECALADHDGSVDFHEAEDCTMGSLNTKGYRGQTGRVITVPCTTVDQMLAEEDFVPDLVKIDVEGFEDVVLGSATTMLQTMRPRLVIEVNPEKDCTALRQIFAATDYAVWNITGDGLVPATEIFPSPAGNNWLCVPRQKPESTGSDMVGAQRSPAH